MPKPLFKIQPLLDAIESNSLILTPNSRLRNKVLDAFHQHQNALAGTPQDNPWPAPRIASLAEWLHEQYQQLLDRAVLAEPCALATSAQLQQLWMVAITADSDGSELINPTRLATDAAAALRSLQRWQLSPQALLEPPHKRVQGTQFVRWAEQLLQRLQQLQLQTSEQMQATVMQAYIDGLLEREPHLLTLGFEETPPLTQATFAAIALRHTRHDPIARTHSRVCQKEGCRDQEDEMLHAALWAQDIISRESGSTIGIIVPDLGQRRQLVERIFLQVFEPHYLLPETARYTLPFNFSAGVPLGSTPLIRDTINLLRLNLRQWPTEGLINLLISPFWGKQVNLDFTDRLCSALQSQGRRQLKTSRLRALCHTRAQALNDCTDDAAYAQWLDHALQQVEGLRRRAPTKHLPSQWLNVFFQQLQALSWPGERQLDSNEYQQLTQWYSLLENFAKLDNLAAPLGCSEAIDLLSQLATGEHYQAQTPDSPIQILGILEGAGLEFNHCRVLGMNQREWPPAPQPNPLLPLDLQRSLGMPHADAARELQYAQALTQNYRRCAEEVIFSYARHDEDTALHASALIADLPELAVPDVESTPKSTKALCDSGLADFVEKMKGGAPPEWVQTAAAPTVDSQELKTLKGGSQILRHQAIAPFAAFAVHRLGAKMPPAPCQGFSAIDRGQILHDALADIWQSIGSQKALLSIDERPLQALITEQVDAHLRRYQRREPELFGAQYVSLESRRQNRLITQWLELEKRRPPFEVMACEETLKVTLAGLPLTLRLDRLDQLQGGELMVIDYKTGTPSIKSWGSERPEEPQLPLYTLCYSRDIDALMFAQINTREIAIKGLGQLATSIEGIAPPSAGTSLDLPDSWEAIRQHWRNSLEQLAEDFLTGETDPTFKSPSLQRFYQDLAPIMRWAESDAIREAFMQQQVPSSTAPSINEERV